MINNTYKEFQAHISEKLPISVPIQYKNGGDTVNKYFKISDAKSFAFYKVCLLISIIGEKILLFIFLKTDNIPAVP